MIYLLILLWLLSIALYYFTLRSVVIHDVFDFKSDAIAIVALGLIPVVNVVTLVHLAFSMLSLYVDAVGGNAFLKKILRIK